MVVLSGALQKNSLEKVLDGLSPVGTSENLVRKGHEFFHVQKNEPVKEDSVKDSVEQANKLAVLFDRSLKFEYRKEADIYQVSVIDTSKDEVVRKIPPDEVVRFIENIKELFGALFDVQA